MTRAAVDAATATAPGAVEVGEAAPVAPGVDVTVEDLRLVGQNGRVSWQSRQRRTRMQWGQILAALDGHVAPPGPWTIELTRTAWGSSDPDNTVSLMKVPIDALAWWLGCDDRDPRLHWRIGARVSRARIVTSASRYRGAKSRTVASLKIVIRPWVEADGPHPLMVLARTA